jgi:hypothetical protein
MKPAVAEAVSGMAEVSQLRSCLESAAHSAGRMWLTDRAPGWLSGSAIRGARTRAGWHQRCCPSRVGLYPPGQHYGVDPGSACPLTSILDCNVVSEVGYRRTTLRRDISATAPVSMQNGGGRLHPIRLSSRGRVSDYEEVSTYRFLARRWSALTGRARPRNGRHRPGDGSPGR